MFRDGARKSIWQSEIKRFEDAENEERCFDVAIIGGGITGISIAYKLQQFGLKCVILESNNIGYGTTGGTTAHLNDFFDTSYNEAISKFGLENAKLLYQAGQEALSLIKNNIQLHQINCDFKQLDAHLFATDEAQEKQLEEIVEGSNKVGRKMEFINQIDFPIPFRKAALISNQAQFHPIKYIKTLADEFIKAGGTIMENCLCECPSQEADLVNLETSKGQFKAEYVVYATHTPPGISLLHFTTAPYRSYALACTLKNGNYPTHLGYDLYDPYHYFRTQEIDGKMLLIVGGEDHKTGHEEDTGIRFSNLENYCRQYFDVDKVEYTWSSQYYEPADGLPSIGLMPSSDSKIFVATGFRGNGMIFGSIASVIITDLITKGYSPYAKLFNPKRFKPTAGFSSFVKENATVVKDLIQDKINMEKIQSLAEIKEGEAKVVSYEGNSYAIYAEKDSHLHILKSTCPHAHCEVRWNSAEISWDCPCHGSRFNVNGKILTGPSTSDLTPLNDEL